jgi:rhodanese-related sulfurtransferase
MSTTTRKSISVTELQPLVAAGKAELLDVRTPGEFAEAHVPGARNIPLDDLNPGQFLKGRCCSTQPLYVLCLSGGRATRAIDKLAAAGFGSAVLVEGGTEAWVAAGLAVNRGQSRVLPLIRQVQIVVGAVAALGAGLALAVDTRWAIVPLLAGCGLFIAGLTGFCGLGLLLAKMPWNRAKDIGSCTVS